MLEKPMRLFISAISRRLFPPTETLEGYAEPELIDVIFQKTKAYDPKGDWPEIAGVSSVLDFGGGCGLHYKLARRRAPGISLGVGETPSMVKRAGGLGIYRR